MHPNIGKARDRQLRLNLGPCITASGRCSCIDKREAELGTRHKRFVQLGQERGPRSVLRWHHHIDCVKRRGRWRIGEIRDAIHHMGLQDGAFCLILFDGFLIRARFSRLQ